MASVPGSHCRSGKHELTPENTYVQPSTGARTCRACRQENFAAPTPADRSCRFCGEQFTPRNRDLRYVFCGRLCNDRAQQVRRYGLTIEQYLDMANAQGGRCLICGDLPGVRGLHIDHSHSTGEVRGLLCGWCNPGLGNFRDSPERLRAAASYLESRS